MEILILFGLNATSYINVLEKLENHFDLTNKEQYILCTGLVPIRQNRDASDTYSIGSVENENENILMLTYCIRTVSKNKTKER